MRGKPFWMSAQFLATFAITILTLRLQPANRLAYVFPLTGVQVVICLRDWQTVRSRVQQILAALTGYFAASVLSGWAPSLALPLDLIQCGELWLIAVAFRRYVFDFNALREQRLVRLFIAVAIAVPLASAALRGAVFKQAMYASWVQTWVITGMSHTIGILLAVPLLLLVSNNALLRSRKIRAKRQAGLPSLLLIALSTIAVFEQTSYPFLFLVLPPVMLTVLVWGVEGAAFGSPIVAIVACSFTAYHHGPLWLMTNAGAELRTVVLQLFLGVIVGTALLVGALLDERERAADGVREAQSIYQILLDHSEDMILLSSLDLATRYVSPGVEAITGWKPEEFLKLPPFSTMHVEDQEPARALIESLQAGISPHRFRYRILCSDGSYKWVEAIIRGYGADANQVHGYVAAIRDISTQADIEQAWSNERAELADQNKQLAALAAIDELTGLANRRTFDRMLKQEVARHIRIKNTVSLLMVDVDMFKKFNDRYGHPNGDKALKLVAETLGLGTRASDVVARVGGEEFAVLLPDTDEIGALFVAQKILENVRLLHIEHKESPFGQITVSVGCATWPPSVGQDQANLVQQADDALYRSKETGRNKVVCASSKAG